MSRPSWLQKIYWTRFAKPLEDRQLYAHLLSQPVQSILEIGVGDGQRLRRMARLIELRYGPEHSVRYIGTDEFESANDNQIHLTLKQAHRLAGQLGFKASLIPGDVASALPRVAHKLGQSDLIVIDGALDPRQPGVGIVGNWINRLAHSDSVVLAASTFGGTLEAVDLAGFNLPSRRAA